MTDGSDVALSCVVDDTPEILSSIIPWLATAIEVAPVGRSQIHVHHVRALSSEIAELCDVLGVDTHKVEPFDPRHPHANKIQQCRTGFTGARRVVLTDVDIVFASMPPLEEIRTPVAGKPVDLPNPPIEILRKIFVASGMADPAACTNAFVDSEGRPVTFETARGNYNGGFLVIDREHLSRIGHAWAHWARWLIARIDLLDQWRVHVDQIAFCLAVNELGMASGLLDDAWNYPLHVNVAPSGVEPFILHHHALLDDSLRLNKVSAQPARRAIARVNGVIESFQRKHHSILKNLLARSPETPV